MINFRFGKIVYITFVFLVLNFVMVNANLASHVLWPSIMNMYNDTIDLDKLISTTSTASNTKKGFLMSGDPVEAIKLGVGHIAINITLSGKGHVFIQYLEGLKKRGYKITAIIVNDKVPVGIDTTKAPAEYKNPYFYMIDFDAHDGEWQKYNFRRIVADYSEYVDNWIIGNEINSQLYNYYGPSDIEDYTKVYCKSFLEMYNTIKDSNENANVYISFDQGWDLPDFDKKSPSYNVELSQYKYNAKEQINLINNYLGNDVDWGIALHPYPTPIESAKFWDDEYSGYDERAEETKDKPYLLTAKNFEIALAYINHAKFLYKNTNFRKVIISELAFTSHNGEEIQAAGLYYVWEKVCKYDQIEALLYNAQTDLADGYNFGLTSDKNRKRLIWAVFKDMDKEFDSAWCKDLLDNVLDKYGYVDIDTVLHKREDLEGNKEGLEN